MKIIVDCTDIVNKINCITLTYPADRNYDSDQVNKLLEKAVSKSDNFRIKNGQLSRVISWKISDDRKKIIKFDIDENLSTLNFSKGFINIYRKIFGMKNGSVTKDNKTTTTFFMYSGKKMLPKIKIYIGISQKKITSFDTFTEIFTEYRKPIFKGVIKKREDYCVLTILSTFGDKKILETSRPDIDFIYSYDIAGNKKTNPQQTKDIIRARIKYPKTINFSAIYEEIAKDTNNFTRECERVEYLPGFYYSIRNLLTREVKLNVNMMTTTYEFYDIYVKKILTKFGIRKWSSFAVNDSILFNVINNIGFAPIYGQIYGSGDFNIYIDKSMENNILIFETMKDVYDALHGHFILYIGV